MINPYASAFKKRDDEDEIKSPSQKASFEEKQRNNPYVNAFKKQKQPTFTPVDQPKQKQEEPEKNFFQKAGEAVKKTYDRARESFGKKKDVGLQTEQTEKPKPLSPQLEKAISTLDNKPLKQDTSIYDLSSGKESTSAKLTPEAEKSVRDREEAKAKEVNLINATKAMFGKGDKQLQEDYAVGLSQTYDEQTQLKETGELDEEGKPKVERDKSKYGATAGAVDVIGSQLTGYGQIVSGAGKVARWQGADGLADKLIAKGGEYYDMGVDTSEFQDGWEWKDTYNPRFYTTMIAQGIPFAYSMIPLSIIGTGASTAVASAAGLSATSTFVLSTISSGFLSANAEAAFEAGDTYDTVFQEALASGKSEEEARKIANKSANKTYGGNVAMLTITNSLQFIPYVRALTKTPGTQQATQSIKSKLLKNFMSAAGQFFSEAGEELGQYNIDLSARGKDLDITSPEAQQTFAIGGISGLVFEAGGKVFEASTGKDVTDQVIQNGKAQAEQTLNEIEEELKEEIPEYKEAVEDGKTEQEKADILEKNEKKAQEVVKKVIVEKIKEEQQLKEQVKKEEKEPVAPEVEPVKPTKTGTEITTPEVTKEKVKALQEKARETIGTEKKEVSLDKLDKKDTELLKELKQSQQENKRSDRGFGIEAFEVGEQVKGSDGNTYEVLEFGRNKVGRDKRLSAKIKNIETGEVIIEPTAYSGIGRSMFSPVKETVGPRKTEGTKEPSYKVTTAEVIPTKDGVQTRVIKEEEKTLEPREETKKTPEAKEEEPKGNLSASIKRGGRIHYINGNLTIVEEDGQYYVFNAESGIYLTGGQFDNVDIYIENLENRLGKKGVLSDSGIIKEKEQDATAQTTTIRSGGVSDPSEVRQTTDRKQDTEPDENAEDDQTAVPSESGARPQRIGKVGRATINVEVEKILDSHNYSTNKKDYTEAEIEKLKQYTGAGGKESAGATGKGLLSEYYTPPEVTEKLWSIARSIVPNLNLKTKKALEPSIGIGSLLEGRPENLFFKGYEYQKVSGTIAAIVNDNASVEVGNGQEFGNPGNFEKAPHKPEYDLVMGNPPFGDRASFEKGKGEEPKINRWEEYFIKRGLDSLNAEGKLIYVVNSSFLNKTSTTGKERIATTGRLIAAYRLPEGIFDDTGIGTDIVVFEKTPNIDKKDGSEARLEIHKRTIDMSEGNYFTNNPDNVMGTIEERTNKFGQKETYVKGTIEDVKRLNPIIEQEEVEEVQEKQVKEVKISNKPSSNKFYITKYNSKGTDTEFVEVKGKEVEIKGAKDLFVHKAIEGGWAVSEGRSGKAIAFAPTRQNAIEKAKETIDKFGVSTLNEKIEESLKENGTSPRYTESVEKTYKKAVKSLKPKSAKEPSYASKTIKHVKKQAKAKKLPAVIKPDKKKVQVVKKQTVFGGAVTTDPVELKVLEDTKVDGSVEYRSEAKDILNYENGKYYHDLNYFSGDIYEKIDQLEKDKTVIVRDLGQKQYDKQLRGLEAVKPTPLKIDDITFDPMDRFIKEIVVQKAESEYQSDRKILSGFLNYIRQNRMPLSYGVDVWDIARYMEGRRAARGKKDVMGDIKADSERLFNYYIRNILDKDIQNNIVNQYNREKNSYVSPDYTKFPVQIENMAKYFRKKEFNLSNTQASGVSMLTNKGVGLVSYGVGVGKTHTILTATMVAKQRGWTKRPVFIVPKSTIENTWIGTIKSMFPNETIVNLGGLTQPDIKRLTKERGKDPKKWVKDGEVSVLSHEGLLKLGLSPEQLNDAMTDLDDALSTKGQTERSVAKQQEKLTEIIGKAQSKAGNVMLRDLGFDHLSVDEVHNFRKIFQGAKPEAINPDGTVDKSQTKRFGNIIGGQPSKMAQQLFLISQHILRNNNDRGVYLASATPFENHATEVYNILSLVARNRLRKMGINNINDFYATFSNFETSLEKDTYGNFVNKEVMKSFKNLGELQRLIREFIDYKEDPALVRPDKRVSTPILQMSGPQVENLERIQDMLKPEKGEAEDGAVLKAVTYSVANSVSPYFIKEWHPNPVSAETLIEDSPKLKYSMELLKTLKSKKETSKYGNFLYLGSNGVEYHSTIADYAITHLNYKPSEVGIINGQTSQAEREAIKDKFRDGEITLLIGGDPTKEGIDLQDNGYTTINVALGWNPTEMAQVEGRVWRQGNKRNIAPIIYPLVENSGDIFVYSKYEEKAGRINDVFSYAGRVFDVGELDPKEKKLALMTMPEDKAKLEIEIDKAGLEIKSMMLSTDAIALERLESKIENLESSIQTNEQRIKTGETSWGTKLTDSQMKEYKKELAKAKRDLKNQQIKLQEKEITDIPAEIESLRKQKEAVDIEIGKLEETYQERLAKFQKEYDEMIASRKSVQDHVNTFVEETADLLELSQEQIDEKKLQLLKEIDQQNIAKQAQYKVPSGTADVGGYADIEPTGRTATTIRPIQFPELVSMVKELTGSAPTVKAFKNKLGQMKSNESEAQIRLNPSIFNDPELAAKVLSHEIGHLADWIPDGYLTRGNLLGRIASLNKYMYKSFGELTNKEIKTELKRITQLWKPFDPLKSPKFTKYRYSSRELYADAVSVLLNDPALLQEQAPTFYNAFFEYIDKKPEFQQTYFDLMEELAKGEDHLMDQRLERMYTGFKKAKEQRLKIEEEGKVKKVKPFWERFIRNHVTKSDPIFRKLKKVNVGVVESEAQHVREKLEEYRMRRNDIFLFLDKMKTEITEPLAQIGLTEDDFGIVLTLEREAFGDRIDMANPGGLIGNIPEVQLKHFYEKKGLTPEQIEVFEQIKQRFHDRIFEESKRAADNGNYSKEMFKEKIEPNKDTYATFAIVHYIEKNYISADIKKMVGTMSEHENPYISTLLKTISLIEWNNTQEAKSLSIEKNMQYFPDDVIKAEPKKDGTGRTIGFRKLEGYEVLERMEDGKRVGYNVDPYIKSFFDNDFKTADEKHQIVKILSDYNSIFKKLVTSWKAAFAFWTNPVKDIKSTYIKFGSSLNKFAEGKKKLSIGELLFEWVKAVPTSYRISKGEMNEVYAEMLKDKAISKNWIQFDENNNANEMDISFLLRKYNVIGTAPNKTNLLRKAMTNNLGRVLEGIEFVGGVFEANTKVAAYQIAKKRGLDGKRAGFVVRNYAGTPNYTDGGSWKQIDNDVFVFSNVMLQATRTSLELATDPKTASGYWMRTFNVSILPKIIMAMGISGLFGEAIKDMYEKMTEYDKTFYTTIPLGYDENGKVIYMRIPGEQIDNLIGGVAWKGLSALAQGKMIKPTQVLNPFASFIPDPTPLLSTVGDWLGYFQGRNPYDSYRGRLAIDETSWKAGGWIRFKKMVQYSLNENGLANFKTYDSSSKSTIEATIEKIPIISRMFKTSDYGIQEKYSNNNDQEAARKSILKRELVSKYVKMSRGVEDPNEVNDLRKQMVREYFGGLPNKQQMEEANRLSKKFMIERERGESPYTDKLINSNTNAEKVDYLLQFKEQMGEQEFKDFVNDNHRLKIISTDVIKQLKAEERRLEREQISALPEEKQGLFANFSLVKQAYAAEGLENTNRQLTWSKDTRTKWEKFLGGVAERLEGDQPFIEKYKHIKEGITKDLLNDAQKQKYFDAMTELRVNDREWYDKNVGPKVEQRILGQKLDDMPLAQKVEDRIRAENEKKKADEIRELARLSKQEAIEKYKEVYPERIEKIKEVAPKQAENIETYTVEVDKELKDRNMDSKKALAYALATTERESGNTMLPRREGSASGFPNTEEGAIAAVTQLYERGIISRNYALPHPKTGQRYYGRGYIQLTEYDNYRIYGDAIGEDLVNNPDLALEPEIATKILAEFFKRKGIDKLVEDGDFAGARYYINRDGAGEEVKKIYEKYLKAIQ